MRFHCNRTRPVFMVASALAALASGCASGGDGAGDPSQTAPQIVGTRLATLQLEPGHQIDFYEVKPGIRSIAEQGQLGVHRSLLTADLDGRPLAEVYQKLAPQAAVPQELLDADARYAALAQPARQQPPPGQAITGAAGPGAIPNNEDEQQWFYNTFCIHQNFRLIACPQGVDWASVDATAWDESFHTVAMVGSEGKYLVPSMGKYWEDGHWSYWYNDYVEPGHYITRTGSGATNLWNYNFFLGHAGGDVQLSLVAVLDCVPHQDCNAN